MDQHRRDLGLVDAVFEQRGQHMIGDVGVVSVVLSPSTAIAPRTVSTRIAGSSLMKQYDAVCHYRTHDGNVPCVILG